MRRVLAIALLLVVAAPATADAALRPIGRPAETAGQAGALTVSPDGRFLYAASAGDRRLTIFRRNAATGALRRLARGARTSGAADAFAIAPDGSTLYAATPRGVDVLVRAAGTGALRRIASAPLRQATDVVVAPDGTAVYVASPQGVSAFTRDATTGALTSAGQTAYAWQRYYRPTVAIAPDGQTVYAAGPAAKTSAASLATLRRDPATNALTPLALDTHLATGDAQEVGGLVVTPDGSQVMLAIAAGDPEDEYLSANLDVFARAPDGTLGAPTVPRRKLLLALGPNLVITPDGRLLLTGSDLTVVLATYNRDPATGEVHAGQCLAGDGTRACTKAHFDVSADAVAVSPDGRFAYVSSTSIRTFAIRS